MQKLTSNRMVLLSLVVVMAFIVAGLVASQVFVQAEYSVTAWIDAWDVNQLWYEHSNVTIRSDGAWVPFLHELKLGDFGTPAYRPISSCNGISTTIWGGLMYYGVAHTDNAPLGAPGFTTTRWWSYADCDRDGDGDFDGRDRSWTGYHGEVPPNAHAPIYDANFPDPPTYTHELWLGFMDVLTINQVVSCTTGNCLDELVTTLEVNLDQDCDGSIDAWFQPPNSSGVICFYAEAKAPEEGSPTWSGPLQARIAAGGGDKTVNFSLVGPTAVDVWRFSTGGFGSGVLLEWETASDEDLLGFNIYRAESLDGTQIRLNSSLIEPVELGSPFGHVYTFVDQWVKPAVTYYYWLEALATVDTESPPYYGPFIFEPYAVFLPILVR